MKWQLSLAAFKLGHHSVEFVTWFESLVRGCLETSSGNDVPCLVSDEVTYFDDSRLRKLEVEIHRILHFLMTADYSEQLSARAEHASKVVDRTFILCLRFGQCSLLSSEIHAELEKSLSWLEKFRGEADDITWRGQSTNVSEIIRGIISEFTSCFADMGDAFSEDLRYFYQLGRGISEFQGLLPRFQELADSPSKQHFVVREKLYPVLLRLVKNCEEQAPAFSLKLDEKINDRDFYDFVFDLQEAIETQLTRLAKQESERARVTTALGTSTAGSGAIGILAADTSIESIVAGDPDRPGKESPGIPESSIEDVSAVTLIDTQLLSQSKSESDTHRQSQKHDQASPRDEIGLPGSNRRRRQFKTADHGVEIYGVLVPVEGILKRVLVKFCTATCPVRDVELRRAVTKQGAKQPGTPGTRSQRLLQLRNILRSAFKLPKTADPIPLVEKSDPPEWELNWQLLRGAERQRRPDK